MATPLPAFFDATADGLVPHADARSPWAADMLHGRLLVGLAAWAIDRDHGDADFVPARLTVDLFRSPPMAPASVSTSLVRAGGRVRAVDATVAMGGVAVARASSLHLRRSDVPAGAVEATETVPWDAAPPSEEPDPTLPTQIPFDLRPIDGRGFGAGGPAPKRVWMREHRPLVAGEPLGPFVRVALAADFASPLANGIEGALQYINADVTLHLGRLPAGEWVGIATDDRVAADGVSVVQCVYHDEHGPLGWSSACALRRSSMG